jgi:hypothetical protein
LEEINFNINYYAKVKLTPHGINILKLQHEQSKNFCPNIGEFKLELDKDGYYKDQLHSLMYAFGKYMTLGMEVPFETNIILISK